MAVRAFSRTQKQPGRPASTDKGRAGASAHGGFTTQLGPGKPLDAATRASMESRFGHDFSRVRVHADGRAARSARAAGASAYTVGSDIVFAAGKYSPGSAATERLLLHELTHVVQQSGAGRGTPKLGAPDNAFERQAADVARGAVSPAAAAAAPLRAPLEIQRQLNDSVVEGALNSIGALDHELLAARLLHIAVEQGTPHRAVYALDSLTGIYSTDLDDVARAFINYAHSSGRLATLASTGGGRILLNRLINELRGWPSFADEEAAAALAESAIEAAERREAEARAARVRLLSGQAGHTQFLDWVVDANLDRLSEEDLLAVAHGLTSAPRWPEFNRLPEHNRNIILRLVMHMPVLLAERARARHAIEEFDRTTGRVTALRASPREELQAIASMGPFGLIGLYGSLLSGHDIHRAIAFGQSLAGFDGLVQAAVLTTGAVRAGNAPPPTGGGAPLSMEGRLPHAGPPPSPTRAPAPRPAAPPVPANVNAGRPSAPVIRLPVSPRPPTRTPPTGGPQAQVLPRPQVLEEPARMVAGSDVVPPRPGSMNTPRISASAGGGGGGGLPPGRSGVGSQPPGGGGVGGGRRTTGTTTGAGGRPPRVPPPTPAQVRQSRIRAPISGSVNFASNVPTLDLSDVEMAQFLARRAQHPVVSLLRQLKSRLGTDPSAQRVEAALLDFTLATGIDVVWVPPGMLGRNNHASFRRLPGRLAIETQLLDMPVMAQGGLWEEVRHELCFYAVGGPSGAHTLAGVNTDYHAGRLLEAMVEYNYTPATVIQNALRNLPRNPAPPATPPASPPASPPAGGTPAP